MDKSGFVAAGQGAGDALAAKHLTPVAGNTVGQSLG